VYAISSQPDEIIPPKFTADSTAYAVALGNGGNPQKC
jgi:hypothetical protein